MFGCIACGKGTTDKRRLCYACRTKEVEALLALTAHDAKERQRALHMTQRLQVPPDVAIRLMKYIEGIETRAWWRGRNSK